MRCRPILKGETLKGFLLLPVNLLFYPATLFALLSIGDYEHLGAASRALPVYRTIPCVTAPFWAWALVDASRPKQK